MSMSKTSDGKVTITFDPKDPMQCGIAICEIKSVILVEHSAAMVHAILSAAMGSNPKRRLQELKNWELLLHYERSRAPLKKFARFIARENKALGPLLRWGPSGSTNPEILERHIKRLKKKRGGDISK
jgi:hypothetical protein